MGILDNYLTRKQVASIPPMSLQDRLTLEAVPWTNAAAFVGTLTGSSSIGTLYLPGAARAFWVENVVVSSNKNIVLQVGLTGTYLGGGQFPNYFEVIVGPGANVIVPLKQYLRPNDFVSPTGTVAAGGATVRALLDADGTNAQVRVTLVGYAVTDDFNLTADKILLHIGDSITAAGTGVTAKYKMYDWQTLNYFKNAGANVRMINMSVSGTTSVDHEKARLNGRYDFPQVDYISYSVGANDASAGNAPSLVQANIAAMITHKQLRYPNAKMVVYGSTPHENNTNETNAVALRTVAQAAVTAAADPKVFYLNLGNSFDRTNLANYATSDAAGTHIHPSDSGHAQVFTVIKNFLDANVNVRP